jgi:hypothetical protein
LVGVDNINFYRLRSLAPLSILDLRGVGHQTLMARGNRRLANR